MVSFRREVDQKTGKVAYYQFEGRGKTLRILGGYSFAQQEALHNGHEGFCVCCGIRKKTVVNDVCADCSHTAK